MSLPNGITIQHIGCFITLCIGIILHIVGLATPCWSRVNVNDGYVTAEITYGLWKACTPSICQEIPDQSLLDSWKAARAFGILSTLAGIGSLGLAFVYFLTKVMNKPDMSAIKLGIVALSICSLVFMIIATSCYGGDFHEKYIKQANGDVGYSLILYAIGGIVTCIGGVLFFAVSGRAT